jgi:hypothetical protein
MSDDVDPTNAIAKELAKQIPLKKIYKDGLAPATQETGKLLADVVKTIRLALAPLQIGAALQDRLERFITESIRRVPEERRITPPPQILGPTVEAIKYEPEGTPVDEMFSELLSRSMDSERVSEAHPAYPLLIRQLSPDETRILRTLYERPYECVFRDRLLESGRFRRDGIERDELPRDVLEYPDSLGFYMDHLQQMNLAGLFEDYKNQEAIIKDGKQWGVFIFTRYRLTQFG